MQGLDETTWRLVEKLFTPEQQGEAASILIRECGRKLPFPDNEWFLERMRFAVLKSSAGNIEKLREAVKLAQLDFRDALMDAGFAQSLTAHKEWAQRMLTVS